VKNTAKTELLSPFKGHEKTINHQTILKGGSSGDMAHGSIIRVSAVLFLCRIHGTSTTVLAVCSALTSEADPEKQGSENPSKACGAASAQVTQPSIDILYDTGRPFFRSHSRRVECLGDELLAFVYDISLLGSFKVKSTVIIMLQMY